MSVSAPSLHGLRDLAAIAAARATLDAAETRAKAEAATIAARQRAAAEAQEAEDAAFQAELEALVTPEMGPVTDAERALADAQARADAARQAAEAAEAAVAAARRLIPDLVDRALAGEPVAADAVAKAHAAVDRAQRYSAFCATVATRFAALVPSAEAALKEAIAEAYRPLMRRGQDLRIEAAAMADAVAASGIHLGLHPEKVAEAHKVFRFGTRLMFHAARHGVHCGSSAGILEYWPTREVLERRAWNRPAPGGDA